MTAASYAPPAPEFRSMTTTWLLWAFLGGFGAHEFYLGRPGIAVLKICTLNYLFVAYIIDLFTLANRVRLYNEQVSRISGMPSPTGPSKNIKA